MPAGLRGRALPRTPPFLESSLPPTAVSGEHARPVSTPFSFAAAAAALRRLSHLTPPSSFPYLRSLLEHLGKARGLGDVESHDHYAGSSSRARSDYPGGSKERAQPPGNAACGGFTLLLSLQPGPPLPPTAWTEASREGALWAVRTVLTILDMVDRSGGSRSAPSVFRPTHAQPAGPLWHAGDFSLWLGSVPWTFEFRWFWPGSHTFQDYLTCNLADPRITSVQVCAASPFFFKGRAPAFIPKIYSLSVCSDLGAVAALGTWRW